MSPARRSAPPDEGPSDTILVERSRSGDHDAFGILVQRYQSRVYHLALRVLRDEEQARDAVQEGFFKAYRSLQGFEGRSRFYTWLYRLVLNLCLDMRRRDRSDRHVEWEDERSVEPDVGIASSAAAAGLDFAPADDLLRKELRRHVASAIDALPDGPREILILREVEDLSYAEIAQALDIPKGTVMSRLHYARRALREHLIAQGVVDGAGNPAEAKKP